VLLHLIRHGRPVVDPMTRGPEWELDPTRVAEIHILGEALPATARRAAWFSSDERKAVATAELLTDLAVLPVPGLREAGRSSFLPDRTVFIEAVTRGLQHPATAALPGWEPLEQTRLRVAAAAAAVVTQAEGDVVLVGHGTAWTLLVSDLLGQSRPLRVTPMAMPDLLVLDLDTRTLLSPWGSWGR
jgi:broad specificity phosphatase PhoE